MHGYGHVENKNKMKLMLKFINRNTCRYRQTHTKILKYIYI